MARLTGKLAKLLIDKSLISRMGAEISCERLLFRSNWMAAGPLVDIYRRPIPLLAAGKILAPHARAMMDVSDGLLLDARRMAEASGCGATIDLDLLPLSSAFIAERGSGRAARLFAATGGDDYALLAALPAELDPVSTLSLPSPSSLSCVGSFAAAGPPLRPA